MKAKQLKYTATITETTKLAIMISVYRFRDEYWNRVR